VAGRNVKIIQIIPKDDMRYGYILAIDSRSGLLLQSLLIGSNRRVMERFQYVDLSLEPDEEAVAKLLAEPDTVVADCYVPDSASVAVAWQASWLPPGFELVESSEDGTGNVAMSFSDGLAFISVFVESGSELRFPDVQAQRGATVAQYANVLSGDKEYAVSVVGEVPPETAGKIAQFIKRIDAP